MDMRRILILVASIVLIGFGILQITGGLSQLLGPAGDPEVAAAAAKAKVAADEFAVLAKDGATTGTVPRQTDPAAKPLLDTAFDTAPLGGKTLGMGDLRALADWSSAGLKAGTVYILAGTGTTDIATAAKDDKAIDRIDANTVTYAPELGRYMDQQIVLQGAMAEVVATDTSASGVDRVRSGMTATVGGVLSTLPLSGLDNAWRIARLGVLTATAPKLAKLLQPAQCTGLRAASDEAGGAVTDQGVKDQLKAFNAALTC